MEGVAKVGSNGARQPIRKCIPRSTISCADCVLAEVLNCKVAEGGAGDCKLVNSVSYHFEIRLPAEFQA